MEMETYDLERTRTSHNASRWRNHTECSKCPLSLLFVSQSCVLDLNESGKHVYTWLKNVLIGNENFTYSLIIIFIKKSKNETYTIGDIIEEYFDIAISVWSGLFVIKSQCVHRLMLNCSLEKRSRVCSYSKREG